MWRKEATGILWAVAVLSFGYWLEAAYGLAKVPWNILILVALLGIVVLYAREISRWFSRLQFLRRLRKRATKAFEKSPRSGTLAIDAMNENPGDLGHVRRVYEVWRGTEDPLDGARVREAFAAILFANGERDESNDVLFEAGKTDDTSVRLMSALEVAWVCSGHPLMEAVEPDRPDVQAWLTRLTGRTRFFLGPIDAATVLSVDEWLHIVHGICLDLDVPLPAFFERRR